MSFKRFFLLAAAAAALTAGTAEARRGYDRYENDCATRGDQVASTIVGAVIGGVIGGQFGNGGDDRALGAVAGALIGGAAGASAARSDCYDGSANYEPSYGDTYGPYYADNDGAYPDERAYYDDAFETAAPYEQVAWNDPDSGDHGTVRPAEWYRDEQGNDCREFEQTIYIDGRAQTATGTACREPDGSWRIVE